MTTVNTFPLMWCESCGRATDPPSVADLGLVGDSEPLTCHECGDLVTLLECSIHSRTTHWQSKPGAAWRYVATLSSLDRLPRSGQMMVGSRR